MGGGLVAGIAWQDPSFLFVVVAVLGLMIGGGLWFVGAEDWPGRVWAAATIPPATMLAVQIVTSLRRGNFGLDAIALLSMSAALVFGEPLAANVVALMYTGGQLLEDSASRRAQREMTALLDRVAPTAMRLVGGRTVEVPVTDIEPGYRLLIRHGEVLPVDGRVAHGETAVDTSALTGESLPVRVTEHDEVLSGSTTTGPSFELIATRAARDSVYAGVVALVEKARAEKPPVQRLADRFAIGFLIVTLAIAGLAWALTMDPIRALSVLVVATPCPLIIAVPVAMISGLSRAASGGVLIKGGGALEALARVRTAIIDKTGTLTHGRASVTAISRLGSLAEDEALRLAASLDQASGHVLAATLIAEARRRDLALVVPVDTSEIAGAGITGTVGDHRVVLGGRRYVADALGVAPEGFAVLQEMGNTHIWVAVDGVPEALIHLEDKVRSDASSSIEGLRAAGLSRIVLASGDRTDAANEVGDAIGADAVYGELLPEQKVAIVRQEARRAPLMMIGDGVNDAPALAAATVGVAMGARGEAASSEAADVVVLVDQLEPIVGAVRVARRTRAIALQSVVAGIGLSLLAMIAAAFGYLPPVSGALLQELIDVAVILNALRALRGP
jgi:heavy metal translocating P-type ATPase